MKTRTKLVVLELTEGAFGWTWIGASLAALYFLVAALAFDGRWSPFLWAVGCGALAKILMRGFHDHKVRVGYEADLVSRGLSKREANDAWFRAYTSEAGGTPVPEAAEDLVGHYGAVLEHNGWPAAPVDLLPAPKQEIKQALLAVARGGHATGKVLDHLKLAYGMLAYFIPAQEAQAVRDFFASVKQAGSAGEDGKDAASLTDADREELVNLAHKWLAGSSALEVSKRCSAEAAQLHAEFDAALASGQR